ncbi:hypothetical protein PR048_033603 [Dryococelus australis]|uniref:Uncharacterized protein n=1 Tax=Dryococelus australis TaxID=614101 RepID=A0ABQ9G0R4_9NEOP|nr:hypothetical protein PR048_033603 [Dryococelus australis]
MLLDSNHNETIWDVPQHPVQWKEGELKVTVMEGWGFLRVLPRCDNRPINQMVRLLASHLCEPGSIPGELPPDFRVLESGLTTRDGGIFSGISLFPPPLHSGAAPHSPRFTLTSSQDLAVKSSPNIFTSLTIRCGKIHWVERDPGAYSKKFFAWTSHIPTNISSHHTQVISSRTCRTIVLLHATAVQYRISPSNVSAPVSCHHFKRAHLPGGAFANNPPHFARKSGKYPRPRQALRNWDACRVCGPFTNAALASCRAARAVTPVQAVRDELCSIPGRVTPGFSQLGIVPDNAAGRLVFSGISRYLHVPSFRFLLHTHLASPRFTLIGSPDLDVKEQLKYLHSLTHSLTHSFSQQDTGNTVQYGTRGKYT